MTSEGQAPISQDQRAINKENMARARNESAYGLENVPT